VKVALDAAAERQRIKEMLSEGTLSGRKEHLSAPELSPASDLSLPQAPHRNHASSTDTPAESAPPAFASSVHEDPSVGARARRRRIAVVFGAVAFCATLLVIALAMRGDKTAAAKAPAPPASVSTAAVVANNIPPPVQTTSATMVPPQTSTTATSIGTTKPAPTIHHTAAPTSTTKPHGTGKPHEVVIQ